MSHTDPRYLEAKRTVDERAFSGRVREELLAVLPTAPQVLEAGCGTGVTVPRLVSWGVSNFDYLGIDRDERLVAFARDVRPKELRYRGHDAIDTPRGGRIEESTVRFEVGDALDVLPDHDADLVVAGAFLDLVPLEPAVDAIDAGLRPGGLAYLPITFDGGTIFQPDHPADAAVERAYHAAIDARAGRDSRAGRHLLSLLEDREGTVLAADASDWVVRPRERTYLADEAYFLQTILDTIETTVDPTTADVDDAAFTDWLTARRRHLANGDLIYVAHQYDLLYRTPE